MTLFMLNIEFLDEPKSLASEDWSNYEGISIPDLGQDERMSVRK